MRFNRSSEVDLDDLAERLGSDHGAMARITPPRTTDAYPDRDLDCQLAAEDAFQELVANIVAAGRGAEEVNAAIEQLAMSHGLAFREITATEAAIRSARDSTRS